MLTEPKYTPKELTARYLAQLNQLLATAQRTNNQRVIVALQKLIEKRGGR